MLVFRVTDNKILVGRSAEDANAFELLGTIPQPLGSHDSIPPRLRKRCSPEELRSLQTWLTDLATLEQETRQLEERIHALTLPRTLADAQRWFATTDHPQAELLALRIAAAMQTLDGILEVMLPVREEAPAQPMIRGRLDQVTPRRITGWVVQPGSEQPLKIRLRINDRELCLLADQPRPDVMERGLHPTGHCGFRVHLTADEALSPGDVVQAFIEPDGPELANSPAYCPVPAG